MTEPTGDKIVVDHDANLRAARDEAEMWRTAKDRLAEQLNRMEVAAAFQKNRAEAAESRASELESALREAQAVIGGLLAPDDLRWAGALRAWMEDGNDEATLIVQEITDARAALRDRARALLAPTQSAMSEPTHAEKVYDICDRERSDALDRVEELEGALRAIHYRCHHGERVMRATDVDLVAMRALAGEPFPLDGIFVAPTQSGSTQP